MTMTPNRTPCSTCPGSFRDRRAWVGGVRVTWLLVVLLVFMGPFVAAGGLYAWWSLWLWRRRRAAACGVPTGLGCDCGRFPVMDDFRLFTTETGWMHSRALCCPASEVVR